MENKVVFSLLFVILISFIASTQQVDVTMKYARNSFAHEYGTIVIQITNNDKEVYRFLSYQTVFEDFIAADMFEVKAMGGDRMNYMGPMGRRITPPPSSAFIEVQPGTSLSVNFNITKYYEITRSGFFTITSLMNEFSAFNLPSLSLYLIPNNEEFSYLNSNSVALNEYTNCKAGEITQIDSSTKTAINQATRAYNCMAANSCSTLCDTWFGAYSTTNYNYDLNCFYNIETTLNNKGINAYCNPAGCGSNVYAYVYPSDPAQTVYLCGAFWSQPGEQANTIVHEMSHFNVIAGTQDYTYGRVSCKSLASNNPYQASRNADNVCYFSDEA